MTIQLVIRFCLFQKKKLKKNYKFMAVDLSKKTKLKDPQQITFSGKPDEVNEAAVFFIIEKSEETTFNFSQNSATFI